MGGREKKEREKKKLSKKMSEIFIRHLFHSKQTMHRTMKMRDTAACGGESMLCSHDVV